MATLSMGTRSNPGSSQSCDNAASGSDIGCGNVGALPTGPTAGGVESPSIEIVACIRIIIAGAGSSSARTWAR